MKLCVFLTANARDHPARAYDLARIADHAMSDAVDPWAGYAAGMET